MRIINLAALFVFFAVAQLRADEIQFVEDFALAKDRTVPLAQLIPGTEDYYYFHCLHYQNKEQFDKVDELVKAWVKRHNYTQRVRVILNRQALLTYDKNPEKSLEYLQDKMGLQFNHQRETLGVKPNYPTALDQKLISRATLRAAAMKRYNNLQDFEDTALDWLAGEELDPNRRRNLLQRMTRPDHENLSKLVVDDLNYKYSRGFGSLKIHQNMLLSQLAECVKLKPDLLNQTNFVNISLSKLLPHDDVDWRRDDREYSAYLDRLWNLAAKLAPVHNSLKAHVLYHRLVFDRSQGKYDKDRFMTYIKLPRNASYVNRKYLELEENRRWRINLGDRFSQTKLPPIVDDEPLVRSYLHHFFEKETSYKPCEPFINDLYLKHNFAETKIVNGLGEPEQWYSMLPPEKYQSLKERIDLDFADTNAPRFAVDEVVSLDLFVKNVKTLIVKVYELNTDNFYRQFGREIDTDINLDGLVPNEEKVLQYKEPPLRRMKRHFEFPSCDKRGVYVVDFIGNGRSSRVLVRKGQLHYVVRTTTAGHEFTVLNEENETVPNATILLAGHKYTTDKDGTITVPFSNSPTTQRVILSDGDFCSLTSFRHQAEEYDLAAGIYVDRESLLNRRQAKVVVRPSLTINGEPVTLSLLEDIKLVITSTDLDGISTTKEVADFQLFEDRESVFEFQVPARLANLTFDLQAKVQNLSQNKKVDVSSSMSVSLNSIDKTDHVAESHLGRVSGGYYLELRGRTGEPRADQPIRFSFKHRDFKSHVNVTLQTDGHGRVTLGKLVGIDTFKAMTPHNLLRTYRLTDDRHSYYGTIHAELGETISLPYMGAEAKPDRDSFSLLETHNGQFVVDRFENLSIKNGLLQIKDLMPGNYDLLIKSTGRIVKLRVVQGQRRAGYVVGDYRKVEVRGEKPLHIKQVVLTEKTLDVQLENATKFSRVHVFATRVRPAFDAFEHLSRVRDIEPNYVRSSRLDSAYVAGRDIGDEYRYIIDRKYAKKYPGNLLERPSMLLNPWAIRSTDTSQQSAKDGGEFDAMDPESDMVTKRSTGSGARANRLVDFSNLDFLADASAVLVNLRPDKSGVCKIPVEEIGEHHYLHVVAVDPQSTTSREFALAETKTKILDLRLANGLDPDEHFTQKKQISVLRPKGEFVMPDISSSRFEAYDSLAKVYSLYATLGGNQHLIEFNFILEWPGLKQEEKREKYSKYACHELSFFLYQKDREFFDEVVKPYLVNKKDKTFLDLWLIGRDLDEFRKPWNYGQLNIVERILLAQRINDEREYAARHVRDLHDLIPPNVNHFNHLFDTAVKGQSLDVNDALGYRSAKESKLGQSLHRLNSPAWLDATDSGNDNAPHPPAPIVDPNAGFDTLDDMEKAPEEAPEPGDSDGDGEMAGEDASGEEADEKNADEATWGRHSGREDRFFDLDLAKRVRGRQFYRKLDATKEWVENNYYQLAIANQNANLVTVISFWRDYSDRKLDEPFYSAHFAEASRNFTEMMFALSVLDLPFEAPKHDSKFDKTKMTLTPAGPIVVYHEEIKPVKDEAKNTPILVSQNFFRHGDRYRHVNNQRIDKFVDDEFLIHAVYGCQVVVTNPTSSPQKLDLLVQIPVGSLPVLNSKPTRSVHVDLQPYHTRTLEYHFYFPDVGEFEHYPIHVARNEELVAFAEPFVFKVVREPSKLDRESWNYVSQHGSSEDVLAYLKSQNLHRTDLNKIAFRMSDAKFFRTVVDLLGARHAYNHTLWSYAIKHDHAPAIREFLQHSNSFVGQTGSAIQSTLLVNDPVVRRTYEHMDYRPLVNARAHQLGRRRQILNERFYAQYHRLMNVLSCQREMSDDDLMAVTYYMLLQDRIDEALAIFSQVDAKNLETRLQYDYFVAYLNLFKEEPTIARDIVARYANHPVDRWRSAFAAIGSQLDELEGGETETTDPEDRTQKQTELAATQPGFDFKVESQQVTLNYQNLNAVTVNYYRTDVELLFSRNPFVQQDSSRFSLIRPNETATVKLPKDKTSHTFALPDSMHNTNVLVEVLGGGQSKSQAYYSHSLNLQLTENYGQLRVNHVKTDKPLPKTYVKVYARMKDGQVKFYKDGYTDLRGRFDYTSLNTNELEAVQQFSLLILSEKDGGVVREVNPPKR